MLTNLSCCNVINNFFWSFFFFWLCFQAGTGIAELIALEMSKQVLIYLCFMNTQTGFSSEFLQHNSWFSYVYYIASSADKETYRRESQEDMACGLKGSRKLDSVFEKKNVSFTFICFLFFSSNWVLFFWCRVWLLVHERSHFNTSRNLGLMNTSLLALS